MEMHMNQAAAAASFLSAGFKNVAEAGISTVDNKALALIEARG
jgi:hypothetical protein